MSCLYGNIRAVMSDSPVIGFGFAGGREGTPSCFTTKDEVGSQRKVALNPVCGALTSRPRLRPSVLGTAWALNKLHSSTKPWEIW